MLFGVRDNNIISHCELKQFPTICNTISNKKRDKTHSLTSPIYEIFGLRHYPSLPMVILIYSFHSGFMLEYINSQLSGNMPNAYTSNLAFLINLFISRCISLLSC